MFTLYNNTISGWFVQLRSFGEFSVFIIICYNILWNKLGKKVLGEINLRLDKYLKVSRLIKRRTLAKEICDAGAVTINGRAAKAGTEVKPGDILEIRLGSKLLKVEITATPEAIRADQAKTLYNVLGEKRYTEEI